MVQPNDVVDPRSGFCKSNSVFYSKRQPIPLPPNEFLDVTSFISSHAHFGHTAFVDASTGSYLTYSDLWRKVDSVANALSVIGIKNGDVVFLLSPNSIYFPVVCLAVMSLGAIITTTNPLNTPREIAAQVADSRPVLGFVTYSLVTKLSESCPDLPIVLIDDGAAHPPANQRGIIVSTLPGMMQTASNRNVKERVNQNDTATLLYSSGTTGPSKGVASSHRNLIAMVQTIVQRFHLDKGEERRFICTVPMFHIYGLAAFATGLLASGSTVILISKFEMGELLSAIERYKATDLPLVPPILMALINGSVGIASNYDMSSLRCVISGGAPLGKEVIESFVEKYPSIAIQQGYGLTESTGIGASTDDLEESRRYGTAGLLSPSMEAMIVDPDTGRSLTINQTGELWLRGPHIMKGYFGNAEATAATLNSAGWVRTGDVCFIDEDGFIFVVDRLKELIKYKGYQVPPAELESLLLSHEKISDAAVVPFPDKEVGQYPMAFVVRKEGVELSKKEVMQFVAQQVAPYKRIRRVAFINAIPRNASGKILRKDLIAAVTSKL